MIPYILLAVIGIGLIVAGIIVKKKFRIAFFIVGGLSAAAGLFLTACTLILLWGIKWS